VLLCCASKILASCYRVIRKVAFKEKITSLKYERDGKKHGMYGGEERCMKGFVGET
jgi:hypothetical protein